MAYLEEAIQRITDTQLRLAIQHEVRKLKSDKKFGLVFEEHLPELAPLFDTPIKPGMRFSKKIRSVNSSWLAISVSDDAVVGKSEVDGSEETFPLRDVVAIKPFGQAVYPALTLVDWIERDSSRPWHALIEADNYHALQLFNYLHPGQVDCIYIDPPYNTGDRNWKYNNDYVGENDAWKHSKWLAMMQRRLLLARTLLKPDGVLIITIDENEVHHLAMLLERVVPDMKRQMVTIVSNPGGSTSTQGLFSRVEEYAIFCFNGEATPFPGPDDMLSPEQTKEQPATDAMWQSLLRRGERDGRRQDRYGMFYPIFVDPVTKGILRVGDPLPREQDPEFAPDVAWPIRRDGSLGRWRIGPESLRHLVKKGFAKVGRYDAKRRTWTVLYLQDKTLREIETGVIRVSGHDLNTGAAILEFAKADAVLHPLKTVWNRSLHHAGSHGSTLLREVLGPGSFSYPKSIYATRDAIAAVVRQKPHALVLDFFAGSGTTLHSVNLLNAEDGGNRRCILVTNNEVSADEEEELVERGIRPGDTEWESLGICRAVTWPRLKYTTAGHRDDGSLLQGKYHLGVKEMVPQRRIVASMPALAPEVLNSFEDRKAIVRMCQAKMSLVDGGPWYLHEKQEVAILWDASMVEEFCDELSSSEASVGLKKIYLPMGDGSEFRRAKALVQQALPSVFREVEKTRHWNEGFDANIAFLKLNFLDPLSVELGNELEGLVPLLWLMAGGYGNLPQIARTEPFIVPNDARFALLVREDRFREFRAVVEKRDDLEWAFLVTDNTEAFFQMRSQLERIVNVKQLYKNYLENFEINVWERKI
ncbi:MAG: site-specific DNA-methyltransferase [Sulfobacillus benefaciens]|uniref:Site-specific DNA-methyltransferase n=1 Tax=Sulfobacillus benefaciens TaxID=453960 RepID=A0A2T2WTF6_9FIRM|nr:MAG: site-specific DNA-methyltransferase [Sulfobacillus benefaciens]